MDLRPDDRWSSNRLDFIVKFLVFGTSQTKIVLNHIWLLGFAFTIIRKSHKSLALVFYQPSSEDRYEARGKLIVSEYYCSGPILFLESLLLSS